MILVFALDAYFIAASVQFVCIRAQPSSAHSPSEDGNVHGTSPQRDNVSLTSRIPSLTDYSRNDTINIIVMRVIEVRGNHARF